jgi:hypothetical protein
MLCKAPTVPIHLQLMEHFFHNLQLDPDAPHKPCAPTLQAACCVAQEPVQPLKWVGSLEQAVSGKLDHIGEAWATHPE